MAQHLLMIEDSTRLATMVDEYLRQSSHGFAHATDAASSFEAYTKKFINQTCFFL